MVKASTYDVGDVVRLWGEWTDTGGSPIVPVTPRFLVQAPDKTVTTYTTANGVTANSTTEYFVDITITDGGRWRYRCESTGNTQAASESWFKVATKRVSTG